MNVVKATARLQMLWNALHSDDPRTIKKVIAKPRSASAIGWTWAAVAHDGKWSDLGYTEDTAARCIRYWNTPSRALIRKMESDLEKLEVAINELIQSGRATID